MNLEEAKAEFGFVRPLPDTYRVPGVRDIPQIVVGEKAAVYGNEGPDGKHPIYEVFKIKISKPAVIKGNDVPARIRIPGNECFGVWAWVFTNRDKAMARFEELEKATDDELEDIDEEETLTKDDQA